MLCLQNIVRAGIKLLYRTFIRSKFYELIFVFDNSLVLIMTQIKPNRFLKVARVYFIKQFAFIIMKTKPCRELKSSIIKLNDYSQILY